MFDFYPHKVDRELILNISYSFYSNLIFSDKFLLSQNLIKDSFFIFENELINF